MTHRHLTNEEIADVLDSHNFSRFLDTVESGIFEAKGPQPYDLDAELDRFELAKDVCAFANANGGYLVIGLNSSPLHSERTDVVASLALVPEGDFPLSKYKGVIKKYVYPLPDGLDVRWVGAPDCDGVGLIYVPVQHPDRGPFLVTQTYVGGARLKGTIFGHYQRQEADAVPMTVEQLQRGLKSGLNTVGQRLERIELKIDSLLNEQESASVAVETSVFDSAKLNSRMLDIANGQIAKPIYVLAAAPPQGFRIRDFYRENGDSVMVLMSHPRRFRRAGFDISTGGSPVLKEDEYYEVIQGDRKALRLYKDGTMIFRGAADESFLGWGQKPQAFEDAPRLNPVAVVEAHASFVAAYAEILKHVIPSPDQVRFSLSLRNARVGDRPLGLTEYYSGGIQDVYMPTLYRAHSADASEEVQVSASDVLQSPFQVAYRLVSSFYNFFDMDHELIPFVTGDAEECAISVEAIRAI